MFLTSLNSLIDNNTKAVVGCNYFCIYFMTV